MKAFEISNIVDTTGAGDIFHGAWIYGYLENWETKKIAEFACAAAALQCTSLGTRPQKFKLELIMKMIGNGVKK